MMPTLTRILVGLATPMFLTPGGSAQVIYSTGFEPPAFTPGPILSQQGWGVLQWGDAMIDVVAGGAASGSHSLRVDATGTTPQESSAIGVETLHAPSAATPVVRIAWRAKMVPGGGQGWFGLMLASGSGSTPTGPWATISLSVSGRVWYTSESHALVASSLFTAQNQWHQFEVYGDFAARKYHVYVNGAPVVLGAPFASSADSDMYGVLAWMLPTTASTSHSLLDEISVDALPASAACYVNCDQSTMSPVLNVADFTCFLQRFAAGHGYANCDMSTAAPTLNVADFTCFLQRFAQGCN